MSVVSAPWFLGDGALGPVLGSIPSASPMSNREIRHIKTGKRAVWLMHSITYLYHASVDGTNALCGIRSKHLIEQAPRSVSSWQLDPATDYMTCDRCKDLVRYARKHEIDTAKGNAAV